MARVVDERLDDFDLDLVFIAATTAEAKTVEELLTNSGINYTLDFESYLRPGLLGPSSRVGVGSSVITGQAERKSGLVCNDALP